VISRIRGTLVAHEESRVEVATAGGIVYEVEVPLTVAERLPAVGEEVELRTVFVVREDVQALYGLLEANEKALFDRLLTTKGVGGKNAMNMLSTYAAPRLIQILTERDVAALTQVSGIGRKTAERLVLELSDRMDDLEMEFQPGRGVRVDGAQAAVQALTALGMSTQEAERSVRAVLEDGTPITPEELIRKALARE